MELITTRGARCEYLDPLTGETFFSVSQILHVLDPDQYKHIDPDVLKRAAVRGKILHSIFAMLLFSLKGLVDRPVRPDSELAGYYDAMVRWIDANDPDPVLIEEPSVYRPWKTAGQPDLLAYCGSTRILTLLDLKSTGQKYRTHRVQVQVYRKLEGYQDAEAMRVLYVRPDGTFIDDPIDPDPADVAGYMNAVQVLTWRQRAA